MDLEAFRAEMRTAIRDQSVKHDIMLEKIGEVASIKEDVRDLKKDVQGLLDLKKTGIGFIAAITLTAGILILGVKGWIVALIAAVKGA
jgi:dihydrodipicolinate synthase/N-acetylneuraminate lyase